MNISSKIKIIDGVLKGVPCSPGLDPNGALFRLLTLQQRVEQAGVSEGYGYVLMVLQCLGGETNWGQPSGVPNRLLELWAKSFSGNLKSPGCVSAFIFEARTMIDRERAEALERAGWN